MDDASAAAAAAAAALAASGRKRTRRTGVQRLYDVCKAVFAASTKAPTNPKLLRLVGSVVDSMSCWDFGLEEEQGLIQMSSQRHRKALEPPVVAWPPVISYLPIYESRDFSIGIFCLPASSVIPLHNHPGMTVFGKLLCGTMHLKAYDWADSDQASARKGLAKLVADVTTSAPCPARVLFPDCGGNIHALTAITDCAILDVLAPPYCPRSGRHCSYYTESAVDDPGLDSERYSWLEECAASCEILSATYQGPRFRL